MFDLPLRHRALAGSYRVASAPPRYLTAAWILAAVACSRSPGGSPAAGVVATEAAQSPSPTQPRRYSACALISKAELQAITGAAYTAANPVDDGHSTESDCQFEGADVLASRAVELNWVGDDEATPAERAVSARIPINVVRGGPAFMSKVAGVPAVADNPAIRGGNIPGLGDEAFFGTGALTVRAGEVTLTVRSAAGETLTAIHDSSALPAILDRDKAIARVILGKL